MIHHRFYQGKNTQINGIVVYILHKTEKYQCSPPVYVHDTPYKPISVKCGYSGRFVRLEREGLVVLCEVEVFVQMGKSK